MAEQQLTPEELAALEEEERKRKESEKDENPDTGGSEGSSQVSKFMGGQYHPHAARDNEPGEGAASVKQAIDNVRAIKRGPIEPTFDVPEILTPKGITTPNGENDETFDPIRLESSNTKNSRKYRLDGSYPGDDRYMSVPMNVLNDDMIVILGTGNDSSYNTYKIGKRYCIIPTASAQNPAGFINVKTGASGNEQISRKSTLLRSATYTRVSPGVVNVKFDTQVISQSTDYDRIDQDFVVEGSDLAENFTDLTKFMNQHSYTLQDEGKIFNDWLKLNPYPINSEKWHAFFSASTQTEGVVQLINDTRRMDGLIHLMCLQADLSAQKHVVGRQFITGKYANKKQEELGFGALSKNRLTPYRIARAYASANALGTYEKYWNVGDVHKRFQYSKQALESMYVHHIDAKRMSLILAPTVDPLNDELIYGTNNVGIVMPYDINDLIVDPSVGLTFTLDGQVLSGHMFETTWPTSGETGSIADWESRAFIPLFVRNTLHYFAKYSEKLFIKREDSSAPNDAVTSITMPCVVNPTYMTEFQMIVNLASQWNKNSDKVVHEMINNFDEHHANVYPNMAKATEFMPIGDKYMSDLEELNKAPRIGYNEKVFMYKQLMNPFHRSEDGDLTNDGIQLPYYMSKRSYGINGSKYQVTFQYSAPEFYKDDVALDVFQKFFTNGGWKSAMGIHDFIIAPTCWPASALKADPDNAGRYLIDAKANNLTPLQIMSLPRLAGYAMLAPAGVLDMPYDGTTFVKQNLSTAGVGDCVGKRIEAFVTPSTNGKADDSAALERIPYKLFINGKYDNIKASIDAFVLKAKTPLYAFDLFDSITAADLSTTIPALKFIDFWVNKSALWQLPCNQIDDFTGDSNGKLGDETMIRRMLRGRAGIFRDITLDCGLMMSTYQSQLSELEPEGLRGSKLVEHLVEL